MAGSPDPANLDDRSKAGLGFVRQVSTFAVVGALATAVYLAVANALMFFTSFDARWASVLAYGAGMVVSFLGQSRLTFGIQKADRGHMSRFLVVSAVGLLVSYFSVVVVTDIMFLHPAWATAVTVALVPLASFVAMKLWVFASRS